MLLQKEEGLPGSELLGLGSVVYERSHARMKRAWLWSERPCPSHSPSTHLGMELWGSGSEKDIWRPRNSCRNCAHCLLVSTDPRCLLPAGAVCSPSSPGPPLFAGSHQFSCVIIKNTGLSSEADLVLNHVWFTSHSIFRIWYFSVLQSSVNGIIIVTCHYLLLNENT